MIEDLKPQSDTLLAPLREENISRRILTVRGHSVILEEEVVTKCDHLSRLKFSPVLPFAYTEHGTIMAASVLNSQRAVETSVFVVRAFVRMREIMASHRELAQRLNALEKTYDARFRVVFDAIRALMNPPKRPRRRIGF